MNERVRDILNYLTRPHWSRKEESLATRRMSLLIASGMSVPDAILALAGEQRAYVRAGLLAIAGDIEGGLPFSSAASAFPGLFSSFSLEVIRVGEESGSLAENLAYLSRELEKQARLRSKLIGTLIYPALLATLTILLSAGLVLFVFPKVLPLFSGFGTSMPLPTRMMIALTAYLSDWGVLTLGCIAVVCVVTFFILRFLPHARYAVLRSLLALPLCGRMERAYRLGSLSRCLGIMLSAGASLPSALRAAGVASGHTLYEATLARAAERTEEGANIRTAFHDSDPVLMPSLARDMLAAGEASGSLPEAAFHLAAYYENEFDEASGRLSTLVEPVLMIFMGLVVGFVAIAMILPIYAITSHLNAR